MVERSAEPDMSKPALKPEESTPEVEVGYDPAAHTVDEVIEYAEEHPDQVPDIYAAEQAGKQRSTLLSHLEHMQA
jgi:hypothetical protein